MTRAPQGIPACGTVTAPQTGDGAAAPAAGAPRPARRVLVVSHEARRTGAPTVALEVLAALRDPASEVVCVLRAGGPLAPAFAAAADRVVREPLPRVRALLRRARALRRTVDRLDEAVAGAVLAWRRPDVAVLNTVKSACYLRPALRRGVPVVLYVHELEPLASTTLARYPLGRRWAAVHLAACSTAARDNLARVTGVPADGIAVVPSPVDAEAVVRRSGTGAPSPSASPAGTVPAAGSATGTAAIRRCSTGTAPAAGRPAFSVGACGTVDPRKGTDLWLEAAHLLRARRPDLDVGFRWIGRVRGPWAESLVAAASGDGLDGRVAFTGEVADPHRHLATLDVLTLTSREDPFPLVVLESMALGLPVVAFDVGGVREQLGEAGVLVDPEQPEAMAEAVARLLDDPGERERLGAAAAERVRALYDVGRFHPCIRQVVDDARAAARPRRRVFLLKYWDSGGAPRLHYRAETLAAAGIDLSHSDAVHRPPWTWRPVRRVVRRLERLGAPFLQTLLAAPRIARSHAVVAMFESQGNFLAFVRALRLWPFTRPRFAVVACWLADDAPRFGPGRRRWYRWVYRRVDHLVFFSRNQAALYRDLLGLPDERLAFVPFGIDHEYFRPPPLPPPSADGDGDGGYVLAVGRDKGRDWATLFEAVRGSDLDVRVACRPDDIAGLEVPANVTVLGVIDRSAYRDLTGRACVVAVATHPLAYPTGQSVTLESMAMARCCVVTGTPAMADYLTDGVNALLVPPGDSTALRAALERAVGDDELRDRIGRAARHDVETRFNAPAMWRAVGELLVAP